jgi:hypothetical protein
MGTKVEGSTRKLCNQRCGKRSNDINQLALYKKGLNLHVAKARLGRTPTTLRIAIFKTNHLLRQLHRNPRSLMLCEF